ncbi:hypothetical protein C4D60_Mb07t23190 [Musa balbisiana]|uniref:CUE domain-containing protein n=1 Tax=Musa balbisiana TaxID=52838 RepID=A0A4S8JHM6_MUSBA|nr:hypothetical protein C4D60_Mb07t23190 [Musa balbisiana]
MSAVVCGKRSSSIFEELLHSTPPPASKRARCASSPTASLRVSPSRASPSFDHCDGERIAAYLARLRSLFPEMDQQRFKKVLGRSPRRSGEARRGSSASLNFQAARFKEAPLGRSPEPRRWALRASAWVKLGDRTRILGLVRSPVLLEHALEASGNDLDSTIKSLNELRLESADFNLVSGVSKPENGNEMNAQLPTEGTVKENGVDAAGIDILPTDGSEWVELFVREMMNASDVDDARTRVSRVLEFLEKSIMARADGEALRNLHKENMMLKEQVEVLVRENTVLKRAVAIQHDRQKEYEERSQELQHLKQLVSQYQEQVRTLEINNYALTVHLRQAQQSSSIPGRFNPDVF